MNLCDIFLAEIVYCKVTCIYDLNLFQLQTNPHKYFLVTLYLLSTISVIAVFLYHLHMVHSRTLLQCRVRSAKQIHTEQWKIFHYCFLMLANSTMRSIKLPSSRTAT